MINFTPGPWKFEHDGHQLNIIAPDGYIIASCAVDEVHSRAQDESNLRLASRAPEMFEVLKELLAEVTERSNWTERVSDIRTGAIRDAENLIKKIERSL